MDALKGEERRMTIKGKERTENLKEAEGLGRLI